MCGKRTLCSREKHLSGAVSDIALQMFHQLLGSDALRAACVPDKTDLTFRDRLDQTDGKHFPARNRFGGKRFRVEADGMRKFQGYVEGGTMEIRGTSKVSSNSEGNLGGSICLYVPEGYYFENTSLDMGAGSLSVEELQTGALEANVGAGKMTFEKLDADSSCPTDRLIIVPIEHFTVNQYISETRQRNTEGSDITELTEVDRKAPREFVIGHSDKYD